MKPVLIFRHTECEGPGYLADFLVRHHRPYRELHIDRGDAVPASPDGAAGLVFMGGPMSVNDDLPWIEPELALIRRASTAGVPVLGHCLGGQLIARALGAEVSPNPTKEIGWHEVHRVDAPVIPGLPRRFQAFHWHGETFSIPEGGVRILASDHCANQAFITKQAVALQFHIEVTGPMVQEWTRLYASDIQQPPTGPVPAIQPPDRLLGDLTGRIAALHRLADLIYHFWIARLQE